MSRLSSYHIMIVSKYFKTIKDFINLELVCKKYGGNMEKFHFNPIPLNRKTIRYFPNIETLCLWNKKDDTFGNKFMINTEENKHCENKTGLKIEFFRIIVWFNVDFETVNRNKNRNIEFKNVTYTQNDREKFGNNIPLNVISIGEECFRQCSNLSSISIPSNVTSLGDGCFRGCYVLSSVTIPSSVKSIGYCCFSDCVSLSSVTIPSSVTSIGDGCFCECISLICVTIPSSVTSISDNCFFRCISLSSVTIPLSITLIGIQCFPSNTEIHRD
ncbi:hypothetical protein EIN_109170 [Entamoeba invadens IP1]|uniref:Leucine rich repeat containing protein BspA family protein n=1 Tax=Entamoeba invadens IP1 TaxID=370355 RepID=L7FQQ6_ENTIV|nr:hypothetical protein EIN_109170 [Entamoeba invadens IP1]ELP94705.1 hypothetical protein EIN_109170 [Entamoeba invadens IP1]|eukprot:XP_004261476.1 hypothetical protein EIN_109170 [Entamoeba invadens IP1]